uniref:Uncharacterized protein n=1 Tax=Amphimedon queenslandica TaxID=400682 RepID=A0A1X7UZ24_AMPQE
ISLDDTFHALCAINPNKAKNGDNIYPSVLLSSATALLEPIHHLFKTCVSQALVPSDWHCHYIIPNFKSSDCSHVTNYRPISILSSIFKILERIIFDKVYDFVSQSSISNTQFGFMKNRSTVKQLRIHTFDILKSFKFGGQLDAVMFIVCK